MRRCRICDLKGAKSVRRESVMTELSGSFLLHFQNTFEILLYKQTNKMQFLYVFILQFPYISTCFEGPFRSSSAVGASPKRKTKQLDTFCMVCTELQIQ